MAREGEARVRFVVGLFVVVLLGLGFVSLFIIGQSEGMWKPRAEVRTDFRTITGLRKGSPVQLAGVEIGTVDAIQFSQRTYTCDPLTEDIGRWGAGRTDDCDDFLFCSPDGMCAELEPYASRSLHAQCISSSDCADDEICVTKEFSRRNKRVQWNGAAGLCARYSTEHRRVVVTMSVFEDKLRLIGEDSTATVASNGVLGDQLVNITQGTRALFDGIEPKKRRIQSSPSLYEDIELFRERIDGLTNKVDDSLSGISSLFSELNDEQTIASVKGTIENVNEITRQMAEGEGMVGALLSDPQYKEDFGQTLRSVRNTAGGADTFLRDANQTLRKVQSDLEPVVVDAKKTLSGLADTLDDLDDPNNHSVAAKLVYDEDGKWVEDVEETIGHAKEASASAARIAKRIEDGDGTLGKLINDSKPHDDLVKILQNLERNETYKRLTRYVIELDEAESKSKKSSSDR